MLLAGLKIEYNANCPNGVYSLFGADLTSLCFNVRPSKGEIIQSEIMMVVHVQVLSTFNYKIPNASIRR